MRHLRFCGNPFLRYTSLAQIDLHHFIQDCISWLPHQFFYANTTTTYRTYEQLDALLTRFSIFN